MDSNVKWLARPRKLCFEPLNNLDSAAEQRQCAFKRAQNGPPTSACVADVLRHDYGHSKLPDCGAACLPTPKLTSSAFDRTFDRPGPHLLSSQPSKLIWQLMGVEDRSLITFVSVPFVRVMQEDSPPSSEPSHPIQLDIATWSPEVCMAWLTFKSCRRPFAILQAARATRRSRPPPQPRATPASSHPRWLLARSTPYISPGLFHTSTAYRRHPGYSTPVRAEANNISAGLGRGGMKVLPVSSRLRPRV
jgi:hypothetical protein